MITVSNEIEAKRLLANGLRFGGAVKKVEKYWEAGPGLVCIRYCGIGHERQGSCGDRSEKFSECTKEELDKEVKWFESKTAELLNIYAMITRVCAYSKRW